MTWTKTFRSAALAIALLFSGHADATGIVPLSGTQQFDKDSSPAAFLVGGQLFVYNPGTTTPAAVFSDFALTVPLASPIVLNTAGRIPPIYGADGSVRLRLLSATSVLQFDDDNVALVTAAISTTPIVITQQQLWSTGDVKVRYDDQIADGYVRANGRTIGSATSGAAERANSDCEALFKFLWPFANITLPAGKGATAAADWSANKTLTLPDMAGRLIGARDDLGAGAKSRITATTVTGPTLAGAVGGTETKAILQANLPAVNFTNSGIALNDPGHTHTTVAYNASAANTLTAGGNGATSSVITSSSNTTGITVSAQGVAASGGSGTVLNTISPVMLFTVYLKL